MNKSHYTIHAIGKGENRIDKKDGYVYHDLDFTNKDLLQALIKEIKPDVIINSGAMTNVDACEKDQEGCWKANVSSVEYMLETLELLKTPNYHPHFIQVSTDFVFDGEHGPYKETDEPNPLSYYAKSKLAAEQAVMNSTLPWSIARTIIIYGVVDGNQRSNLVLWVRNALMNGQRINVITDQHRSPTLSEDLAEGLIQIAERGATGIYHLSGPETKSIWDLAVMIADFWKLDKTLMNPVTSAELNQPAKRPPVTGFVLDKARQDLDYNPRPFVEGLKFVDQVLS